MELRDAAFLITGATGGLGHELARELGGMGARLTLSGRDEVRLGALARELGAGAHPADLRDPAAPARLVEAAVADHGRLDGVVSVAGVTAFGPLAELAEPVLLELTEVNLLAPARLVSAAVPRLGRPSAIMIISAIVADLPTAGMAAYSASKAGISALATAARRELRPHGIRVLDARPPHLATDHAEHALAGTPPRMPAAHDPREVAALLVRALAEDAAEVSWDGLVPARRSRRSERAQGTSA